MPKESLNCPHCGSARVTEFKPNTYVCAHCESTFKWADPTRQVVEHVGQVLLKSDLDCQYCLDEGRFRKAIGKCVRCGRTCCSNHGEDGISIARVEKVLEIRSWQNANTAEFQVSMERIITPFLGVAQSQLARVVSCDRCLSDLLENNAEKCLPKCIVCERDVKGAIPMSCDICQDWPVHAEGCMLNMRDAEKQNRNEPPSPLRVCLRCLRGAEEIRTLFGSSYSPRRWCVGEPVLLSPIEDDVRGLMSIRISGPTPAGEPCLSCGATISQGSDTCPKCGWSWNASSLRSPQKKETIRQCPNCGKTINYDADVCRHCG